MKITDKYVLFWKEFLSQWHMESFVENGLKFNCCEQYMMYKKAVLFNDSTTANEIMSMTKQYDIKAAGRRVKNFDITVWNEHKLAIVIAGNKLRFEQNIHSRNKLLAFDKKLIFVEASPFDPIWGIKMDEHNPLALNESTWQGENLLGKALTIVRDSFL
jgi:ribA/ribD-fused uncharacterized protein